MLTSIVRGFDAAIAVLCAAAKYLYVPLVVIIVIEIFVRYVLGGSTLWGHVSAVFVNAAAFLIGGIAAMQAGAHIRLEFMEILIPARLKPATRVLAAIVVLAFTVLLVIATFRLAGTAIARGETTGGVWNVATPMYLKTIMAGVSGILCLQALADLLEALGLVRRDRRPPDETGAHALPPDAA